jgi:hypothetical protein
MEHLVAVRGVEVVALGSDADSAMILFPQRKMVSPVNKDRLVSDGPMQDARFALSFVDRGASLDREQWHEGILTLQCSAVEPVVPTLHCEAFVPRWTGRTPPVVAGS